MPMRISQGLYDEIVAHALEDPYVECCGLVAATAEGEAVTVYRCRNINADDGFGGASFELDPQEQIQLLNEIEANGLELAAIYHSHPQMRAVPSAIDERYAEGWPGVMWIIVSIPSNPKDDPDVWAWTMEDGRIFTAELVVTADEETGVPVLEGDQAHA